MDYILLAVFVIGYVGIVLEHNIKIDKAKSGDKVDGPVSLVMALGTCMQEAAKNINSDFWFVPL